MSRKEWNRLQNKFALCTLGSSELPTKSVDCPPGKLYPTAAKVPDPIHILFVGVAPPRKGDHFYTDPKDGLALGLFKILSQLGWPCSNVSGFLDQGFFFTHTAKCPIKGTWKPSKPVSLFCSTQFLKREIEILQPSAVCWLSKKVGYPVAKALVREWDSQIELEFGHVTPVDVGGRKLHLLATNWPGRGQQRITKSHLRHLIDATGVDRAHPAFIPFPMGLVQQWLQYERWNNNDRQLHKELGVALNDWEGRFRMLLWITRRVLDDFAVADQIPRNYMQDVALEYHLSYWFITARLCYDSLAFAAVQLSAQRDRGQLPKTSFNALSAHQSRQSYEAMTKAALQIVQSARSIFKELKDVRDSLVHFIGKSGGRAEAPKQVNIDIPNREGVRFTLDTSRFADLYGDIPKWPVEATIQKHFRHLYELASRLECCFLDHAAQDKLPGVFWQVERDVLGFVGFSEVEDHSGPKWEKAYHLTRRRPRRKK